MTLEMAGKPLAWAKQGASCKDEGKIGNIRNCIVDWLVMIGDYTTWFNENYYNQNSFFL
jgi:hypothetical protein